MGMQSIFEVFTQTFGESTAICLNRDELVRARAQKIGVATSDL
jgi:hypothetical protein